MDRFELARRLGAEVRLAEKPARPTVIEDRDPAGFKAAFAEAVAGGGEVFLADPSWGAKERAELAAVVAEAEARVASDARTDGWLMIPSGGTSGRLKFARHDEGTIAAAVRGFAEHFGFSQVNAVGVLPLHHVSGLMSWMRCMLTGGDYLACEWKEIQAGRLPMRAGGEWVISLVPTQLQRLLANPAAVGWLRGFRAIFVGGGPSWDSLSEAAARERLPIALSYGMTETAAMVTALRPEEFLRGERSSGTALPHARVEIGDDGRVRVSGASLFRGYYPVRSEERVFVTDDLGRIDERGQLHVLGRRDAVIISGGKKVQPEEVEAALRASGEFEDVAVIGLPDAEWGEIVVACYCGGGREPDVERAMAQLAAWQRPKRFLAMAEWPRNAQGKVNRAALRAAALSGKQ